MKAIGAKKLPEVRDFMEQKRIDAILLSSHGFVEDANIRYFSGFFQEIGACSCKLLITKEKRLLFVHPFDFERASKADAEEVINIKNFRFSYSEALKKIAKKIKAIGICKSKVQVEFYEKLRKIFKGKIFDVENFLLDLRSEKLNYEIGLIKRAARITNYGIKVCEEILSQARKKKISEDTLAKNLEEALKERGAENIAFPTIVASHKRSSYPHPFPSVSKSFIKEIGFVDFGVMYRGYRTDVTIPFLIENLSKEKKKIIDILMDAYDLAISSVEEGKETCKVFDLVSNFFNKNNFALSHGLGHGIGLEIHEKPSISKKQENLKCKEERFKRNTVFTIEPAIYLKNFGLRLENDFLMQKKIKRLTNAKLIEV